MEQYLQLLATIYANTNAILKKSFENHIQLHNKLQLVVDGCPCGAYNNNIKTTTKFK